MSTGTQLQKADAAGLPVPPQGELVERSIVQQLATAELDTQITTARAFPRSLAAALKTATEMATYDWETAASMTYSLPRGQKKITGPSIRLAEIMASAWGNLRYASRVIAVEETVVVAQGIAHDLERNIAATIEVRRKIQDKNGNRYNEDMITMTGNAACAIALRNAIFKVIPAVYVTGICRAANSVAKGDTVALRESVQKCVAYIESLGVKPKDLYKSLGHKGAEDMSADDLMDLREMANAVSQGDSTIESVLEELQVQRTGNKKVEPVKGRKHKAQEEAEPAATEQEPEPETTEPEPETKSLTEADEEYIGKLASDMASLETHHQLSELALECIAVRSDLEAQITELVKHFRSKLPTQEADGKLFKKEDGTGQ